MRARAVEAAGTYPAAFLFNTSDHVVPCLLEWIGGPLDGFRMSREMGIKHRYLMEVIDTGIFEHCYISEIPVGPGVDRVRLFHTEVIQNEC